MNFQLTDYAVALLNANTGPITLNTYTLGSAYNYIPAPGDTDIHGSLVFNGTPSVPVAVNANIIKYSIYLDYNVGPFSFGEIGLYVGNNLFALGAASELINKIQVGQTLGNSIRIDIYLSMVGTNYQMWFDLAESNNEFRVAIINSPDQLPQSADATPNVYIVEGADSSQSATLAYTDRIGLWNFDAYQFIPVASATILGFDSKSVTIALTDYKSAMTPTYFGEVLLEFITGELYSACRYVKTVVATGTTATLGFQTALAKTPIVGDRFAIFQRNASTTTNIEFPIASSTVLGGVKIGPTIDVATDGTINIDPHASGFVTSVNGQSGDVVLDIPSQLPYDLTFSSFDSISPNDIFGGIVMDRTVTLTSGLAASKAWAETPPTATSSQFNILKNGTQVGTVVFSPGSNTGVFTMAQNQVLVPGDIFKLVADASNFDATILSVMITIASTYTIPVPIPADYWTSIAFGGGQFVAVTLDPGISHVVGLTPDGANWTSYNLPQSKTWTSVTFGSGKFVAVAGGSNVAATSPDGQTWTPQTLPANDLWSSVTFGNGKYVAVAGTGNGFTASTNVAVSTDGQTWQLASMPSNRTWSSVTFGNGIFVAVATNYNFAAISADGINWVEHQLVITDSYQKVLFGNGQFILFAGAHNTPSTFVAVSSDGINWFQHGIGLNTYWQDAAYGNSTYVAIAGGAHLSNAVATSSNGTNWTQHLMPANLFWQSIAFGNGTFVAVAGGATMSNVAATSPDGVSWTLRTI
jgi:hypothetical protein